MPDGAAPAVETYIDASVLVITLARSREGNRLNPEMLDGLAAAVKTADGGKDVRAVLLRSNGPIFCHGMDLAALRASGWKLETVRETVARYGDILSALYTCPVPVIAAVQGEVKAGGVGLVSACDVVIGTEHASFEMAEVIFGIVPANVLPFLLGPRLSLAKARSLILTAKKADAAEALRLGLLDELTSAEGLEKKLKETLKRLLAASPEALAAAKTLSARLAGQVAGNELQKTLELTRDTLVALLGRRETQRAVERFLEGELPDWYRRFKPERPLVITEE